MAPYYINIKKESKRKGKKKKNMNFFICHYICLSFCQGYLFSWCEKKRMQNLGIFSTVVAHNFKSPSEMSVSGGLKSFGFDWYIFSNPSKIFKIWCKLSKICNFLVHLDTAYPLKKKLYFVWMWKWSDNSNSNKVCLF